jgi:hypothetical protein
VAQLPPTPDPNTSVHCSACSWAGMYKEAVAAVDDVVRCPTCLEPVEVTTLCGKPIVFCDLRKDDEGTEYVMGGF